MVRRDNYKTYILALSLLSFAVSLVFVLLSSLGAESVPYLGGKAKIIVDRTLGDRFYILVGLTIQLVVFAVFRNVLRLCLMLVVALGIIAIYVDWWITTFRTLTYSENQSYGSIEHVLFLGNGTILDIAILGCVISTTILILRMLHCSGNNGASEGQGPRISR